MGQHVLPVHLVVQGIEPKTRVLLGLAVQLLLLALTASAAEVPCLPGAHAHNDYLHARPLLDARDHGFCSVEADVHLVNGKLLVAHDPEEVNPSRLSKSE